MFSGIKFPGGFRIPGTPTGQPTPAADAAQRVSAPSQDRFQLSPRPTGEEARVRDTVGQISTQARIRPSLHEIEALKQQIREGTYQPDPREIAVRMLMTDWQEETP